MKKYFLYAGILSSLFVAACDYGPKSSAGFTLPDGDVGEGQQVFIKLQCNICHKVNGLDDLGADIEPIMTVPLGGKTDRIATYGQLVTSIINPSHKISQKNLGITVAEDGQSMMRNYNDIMTVAELIDLVAFLQAQYELEYYPRTQYLAY